MPEFIYGQTRFEWVFQPSPELAHHYITVERGQPVLLRGPWVDEAQQVELIRQRARWIRAKLAEANRPQEAQDIVTGSRLRYRGRTYYVEVRPAPELKAPRLTFTYSRFVIETPEGNSISQAILEPVLEHFYRDKATEKLFPRIRHWERETGLQANGARLYRFASRWASCSEDNRLEFHPSCMELPQKVLDYVIVHELCHIREKSHSKAFLALVTQHFPNWQPQHAWLERADVLSDF